jgi:hypothetical protein
MNGKSELQPLQDLVSKLVVSGCLGLAGPFATCVAIHSDMFCMQGRLAAAEGSVEELRAQVKQLQAHKGDPVNGAAAADAGGVDLVGEVKVSRRKWKAGRSMSREDT